MIAEAPVFDLSTVDFSNPLASIDAIRAINPHRFDSRCSRRSSTSTTPIT